MTKWEYTSWTVAHDEERNAAACELGSRGWELVSVSTPPHVFVLWFKRPIDEDALQLGEDHPSKKDAADPRPPIPSLIFVTDHKHLHVERKEDFWNDSPRTVLCGLDDGEMYVATPTDATLPVCLYCAEVLSGE